MYFSNQDIKELDRTYRLNVINSVSGIKPGNLIGSVSQEGILNVAVISSVVHLSSNPALLGFFMRTFKIKDLVLKTFVIFL